MRFAPHFAGPHRPEPTTPPRAPGSVRRTTTIDTSQPEGFDGPYQVDLRGRDLRTGLDGRPGGVAEARLRITLDPLKQITSVEARGDQPPSEAALHALIGASALGGFRRRLAELLPDEAARCSLWHLLLDDLVGASVVADVTKQHAEALAGSGPMTESIRGNANLVFASQADICAGWARDGVMLTELRRTGDLPAVQGPPAPDLGRADDPKAWHAMDPMPLHSMRRRRRLDAGPAGADGTVPFTAHFRDSHMDGAGAETCVHEYTVEGHVDAARTIVDVGSEARVLPWRECPSAVGSAPRLIGLRLREVRDVVRADFRGTTTCTHLNDTLRSLGDLDVLLDDR